MLDLFHKIRIYGFSKSFIYAFHELSRILLMRLFLSSYSQQGEDIIIDKLLGNKEDGFYVDIGAYDPVRFSNTKRFYDRGWKGINIEPNPALIKKFEVTRKRDTNLALGVGKKRGYLTFYEFFPSTLSTFSEKETQKYINKGFKIISKKKIPVETLSFLLKKYCKGIKVDLMSIDTEGTDLEVLESNNWKEFRPSIVCVETNRNYNKIRSFLKKNGYILQHSNGINDIFSVS